MNDNLSKNKKLSIKWFNSYINFFLPLTIIIGLFESIGIIKFAISIIPPSDYGFKGLVFAVWYILNLVLIIILFIGLKKKKLWSWKLNFVVLILPVFAPLFYAFSRGHSIDFGGYAVYWLLLYLIIWAIPNWIYFKKRKYVFYRSK